MMGLCRISSDTALNANVSRMDRDAQDLAEARRALF